MCSLVNYWLPIYATLLVIGMPLEGEDVGRGNNPSLIYIYSKKLNYQLLRILPGGMCCMKSAIFLLLHNPILS